MKCILQLFEKEGVLLTTFSLSVIFVASDLCEDFPVVTASLYKTVAVILQMTVTLFKGTCFILIHIYNTQFPYEAPYPESSQQENITKYHASKCEIMCKYSYIFLLWHTDLGPG
jgi:hypothetical protein